MIVDAELGTGLNLRDVMCPEFYEETRLTRSNLQDSFTRLFLPVR